MNKTIILFLTLLTFGCQQKETKKTESFPNGFFPIKEYGKWGFINSKGQKVIDCKYDKVHQFSEGMSGVLTDELWGFIDTLGKMAISPQFLSVRGFSNGLALVTFITDSIRQYSFINQYGQKVFETNYERQDDFHNGRALIKSNDEICFIDKTGKITIRTNYPYGSGFSEGVAHLWTGDSTKYIDTNGVVIFSYHGMANGDFSGGYAEINYNSRHFYINKSGEIAIELPSSSKQYSNFSDGLAEVFDFSGTRKSSFIDTSGKVIMPFKFAGINKFSEGFASFVDSSSLVGFINKDGEIKIAPQFEDVDYDGFKNGLCQVKKDRQWGYINHNGEFVWKSQIDIQYKKLDLSKWELDTLDLKGTMYGGKYAGQDNKPKKINFQSDKLIYLKVDTTDITVFADKYYGYKIYLVNGTNDTLNIPAQDGRIKLIQQAINKDNKWQDTENFINSFCGNSYNNVHLLANYYQIYAAPITKGDFKTVLRYRLELSDTTIYSERYIGSINNQQFLKETEKNKTKIAVWAN
jgi:hypothetical protein